MIVDKALLIAMMIVAELSRNYTVLTEPYRELLGNQQSFLGFLKPANEVTLYNRMYDLRTILEPHSRLPIVYNGGCVKQSVINSCYVYILCCV